MRRLSARQWAMLGITAQFMAVVRSLAEVFRLEHVRGVALPAGLLERWVAGSLIGAVFAWLGVSLFFLGRFRGVLLVAALTVLVLLVYRFIFIP